MSGAPDPDAVAATFDPRRTFDHPDPYPLFAALRRHAPVCRTERSGRPAWVVTRHADVRAVLDDPTTWVQPSIGRVVFGQSRRSRAAWHARARAIAARAFTPPAVERVAPDIAATAHRLIDELPADGGPVDLFQTFARKLPVQVVGRLLGLPAAEHERVLDWSHAVIGMAADPARGTAAAQALDRALAPLVRARRRQPADDVLTHLATATADGQGLSEAETLGFLRILIPAAVDPPAQMLGNLLVALLVARSRWERVCAEPSLGVVAVAEALRWETPIVYVVRQPTRPVTLHGVDVPAAGEVSVVIGSANRDDARWHEPERFDLDRPPLDALSFGHGRHFCLGSHLALAIGRIGLATLCERLPHLRLDPDAAEPRIVGCAFRQPTAVVVRAA